MIKVGVCGHFGGGHQFFDGQTIKTKIITEELKTHYGDDQVLTIDTYGGVKKIFKLFYSLFSMHKKCENIIILPAQNSLRIFAPYLFYLNKFKKKRIHYVVIGGWLPEYLDKHKLLLKYVKAFDHIYVETNAMKKSLVEQKFSHIIVLPNCKNLMILDKSDMFQQVEKPFKLCTFSRVMKEKGIEDAIKVVKHINESKGEKVFCLDIFGQIDGSQTDWFNYLANAFPEYIKYHGVVEFSKSTEVLKKYHALVFPTYYEGEGLAGTLIDAMAAGVPVIASDWRYNSEIVEQGVTGLLFKTHDLEDFERVLIQSIENIEIWREMKHSSIKKAKDYLPQNALKALFDNLY